MTVSLTISFQSFRLTVLAGLALAASIGSGRAETVALLPAIVGATELIASHERSGLGLSGYDPVSYLLEGAPRPGLPGFETTWGGLAWRFASAANREAFRRDPATFLPRLGGYDALAAASGRVASADPLLFAVRESRLYLFRTREGRRRFLADEGADETAEAGWSRVRGGLVGG